MNIGDIRALEEERDPERRKALVTRLADQLDMTDLRAVCDVLIRSNEVGSLLDAVTLAKCRSDRGKWLRFNGRPAGGTYDEWYPVCAACARRIRDNNEDYPEIIDLYGAAEYLFDDDTVMRCMSSPAVVDARETWKPDVGFVGYRTEGAWTEFRRQHCTYECFECDARADIEVDELHALHTDDGPWQ